MATRQPGDEQIRQRLDCSFTGLDDQRTENLKQTQLMQTNKDSALKKEQARLQKKYGADHPRVTKISNRIDYNQAALPEMKTEIARSQIEIPEFDVNTWMVHGRVLNQELIGVERLTLALYDAKDNVEKRLGYACTDERGYYAIRYRVEEELDQRFDEKTDYFLTVTDGEGKICHKEEQPLHVVLGQVDYRLIILGDTQCTPPPGWNEDGDDDEDGNGETGEWTLSGTLTYDDNKPGTNLVISVFSKRAGESLATANIGRTGAFTFTFTTKKFPELFKKKPDIFLVITTRAGKQLHVTEKPLHAKVGGMEKLDIVLKRENQRPRQ